MKQLERAQEMRDRVDHLPPVLLQNNHVRAFADFDPAPVWRTGKAQKQRLGAIDRYVCIPLGVGQ
jgi:hypothetical protein